MIGDLPGPVAQHGQIIKWTAGSVWRERGHGVDTAIPARNGCRRECIVDTMMCGGSKSTLEYVVSNEKTAMLCQPLDKWEPKGANTDMPVHDQLCHRWLGCCQWPLCRGARASGDSSSYASNRGSGSSRTATVDEGPGGGEGWRGEGHDNLTLWLKHHHQHHQHEELSRVGDRWTSQANNSGSRSRASHGDNGRGARAAVRVEEVEVETI